MAPVYPIVAIDPRNQLRPEEMGSKAKFWYRASDGRLWLFKRGRERTGEDWAEKIAAEIADVLGLPHARVELADCGDIRGCTSLGFADEGTLIHGNELLWSFDPSYPKGQFWRVTAHTLDNVLRVLSQPEIGPPAGERVAGMSAACVFVGYLLLDALIGNIDRHHENWALIHGERGTGPRVTLAPTYDHASSLGRELSDARRRSYLDARDPSAGVRAYAQRARSALYLRADAPRPLSTQEAFARAAAAVPGAGDLWRERVAALQGHDLQRIIELVPHDRMSPDARAFALALLRYNQRVLLGDSP